LPKWGYWTPEQWKNSLEFGSEIINNKLGWDITDFGSGDFKNRGLILFTVRNGNLKRDKKVYCEKIMIADVAQVTPMHFHFFKMEDIINRGGGKLIMELYNATGNDELADTDVKVSIDGIRTIVKPGVPLVLEPGQSICLTSRVYHKFYAKEEKVLIGEVSTVNDDENDNRFYESVGRFPEIIEDEKTLHLLTNDYIKYV